LLEIGVFGVLIIL